jgi:ubiquinone/menaquinone biosynthesis C-methylase UbiE
LSVPPSGDYPAKHTWQSDEQAAKYRRSRAPEQFHRYHLEDNILQSWLRGFTKEALILDIPCGAGRFVPTMNKLGFNFIGADFSRAMVQAARNELPAGSISRFANADVEHLPFADNSIDCVIIWRFFHHIPNTEIRQRVLAEAARVTRSKVLLSFHHSLSFTHLRKSIQRFISPPEKVHGEAITHWQLQREAQSCGLTMIETKSFRKFVSINWFACLKKIRA